MLALALVLPACVLITQTDIDAHDALVAGDDSAQQDSSSDDTAADDTASDDTAGDTASDDTAADDTGSVGHWQGERVLYVEERFVDDEEDDVSLCELHWSSVGTLNTMVCDACEWAYDVDFSYEGDVLGLCDGEAWYPSYTLGLMVDYIDGQDWMVLYYNDTLYTAGQVDAMSDGVVTYHSVWYYEFSDEYYFIYTWQGSASYD